MSASLCTSAWSMIRAYLIHPFIDGNGRTGRALIHTVLHRTDALRNMLIPISTVFASNKDAYLKGLTAFRARPSRLDD
ncbi:Fic family protein [Cryobacterium sp. MLB-32]|uniref:Fic family protein n=1 Tax=Cryobacterium sp. MLB-32 TaxID=1529318 RepID=UPI001E465B9E|nr:Fic family protein [Cryobacterium sp. MLB-32]